jgi:hypothetical protein
LSEVKGLSGLPVLTMSGTVCRCLSSGAADIQRFDCAFMRRSLIWALDVDLLTSRLRGRDLLLVETALEHRIGLAHQDMRRHLVLGAA